MDGRMDEGGDSGTGVVDDIRDSDRESRDRDGVDGSDATEGKEGGSNR